jgi:hypothetical protein
VNSVDAAGLPPWIADVGHTPDAQPGETILVTAEVLDATSVDFFYLIDFGSEVAGAMLDDGASGDGAAGDGIYGASIPGQPAGTLVRYRMHWNRRDRPPAVVDPADLPLVHRSRRLRRCDRAQVHR